MLFVIGTSISCAAGHGLWTKPHKNRGYYFNLLAKDKGKRRGKNKLSATPRLSHWPTLHMQLLILKKQVGQARKNNTAYTSSRRAKRILSNINYLRFPYGVAGSKGNSSWWDLRKLSWQGQEKRPLKYQEKLSRNVWWWGLGSAVPYGVTGSNSKFCWYSWGNFLRGSGENVLEGTRNVLWWRSVWRVAYGVTRS